MNMNSLLFPEKSARRKIIYSAWRLFDSLISDGVHTTLQKVLYRIKSGKFLVKEKYFQGEYRDPDVIYGIWRKKTRLLESEMEAMRRWSEQFSNRPVISIVIPTYKPDLPYLKRAISSVQEQYYPLWQLCICDDGSNEPACEKALRNWSSGDARIRCRFEKKNGGIVSASQKAAEPATGEFIAFMGPQRDGLFPIMSPTGEPANFWGGFFAVGKPPHPLLFGY